MATTKKEFSIEAALAELETLVAKLSDEKTTLDEALSIYEKGVKLSNDIKKYFDGVNLRLTQVTTSDQAENQ
jgi:Exonuclease VII small subunit